MQEQDVARIGKQLDWTVGHLQQYVWERRGDMASTSHIRVDAALIAVLTLVAELSPVEIQEQVRKMVTLHDEVCRLEREQHASRTAC